jgi:acyl carrier protein
MQFGFEALRQAIAESFPAQDWSGLAPDSSLEEKGLDSLDKATLIMKVEEMANVKIPDEVYDTLDTPGDIIEFIEKNT